MVASSNADLYSPFQPSMLPEEGAQSSEEGSGLHSPVFGAPYANQGDSFRYMLPPQYDYPQNNNIELPSARQSYYSQLDFPVVTSPVNPRISPASATYPLDYHQRRLPDTFPSIGNNNSSSSPAISPAPPPEQSTPASRKEISSVVIACRQCRSRKIRCDSTRPQCNNCLRRSNECEYDLVPKRRGPDKRPGTRQRTCKKRNADGSVPPPPPSKRKRPNQPSGVVAPPPPNERTPEHHQQYHQRELAPQSHHHAQLPPLPLPPSSRVVKENMHNNPRRLSPTTSSSASRHQQDRPDPHYPPSSHSHSHVQHHHQQQSTPSPTDPRFAASVDPNANVHYKHPQHHHQQQDNNISLPTPYRRNTGGAPSLPPPLPPPGSSVVYDQGPPSSSYPKPPPASSSYPRQLDINTFHFTDNSLGLSGQHVVHHPTTAYHRLGDHRRLGGDALGLGEQVHPKFPLPMSPTIEANQKLWWHKILGRCSQHGIIAEFTFLVNNSGHLLSFINLNFLIKQLMRDESRLRIQPAFVLAGLAMAKLMKSSSVELGKGGLQESLALIDDAHAAYGEALEYGWLDGTLAEAALILALYESSAHPRHSSSRAMQALINMDDIIQSIGLTMLDGDDRDVCRFARGQVPYILLSPLDVGFSSSNSNSTSSPLDRDRERDRKCGCANLISQQAPSSPDGVGRGGGAEQYTNRPYYLPWPAEWTEKEVRDEEVRRLCWSAVTLVSDYVAKCEAFNDEAPRFFLADAANFGILFPGEVLDRLPSYRSSSPSSDGLSPKESVWALYCRSMLLWNFCNRFRQPSQEEERAEQANEAFEEAQALEDSLNMHRCNLDTALIYTTKEYIHNTRLLVAQACRSFHGLEDPKTKPGPMFKRKQAEDWLFYQEQVVRQANILINQLNTPQGAQLTRKPFRINWFVNQLAICLILWTHDPTLDDALKLAKSIMCPVDVLNALWPCHDIQQRSDSLRHQLSEACRSRGIEPPLAASYTVPAFVRPE